MSEAVAPAESRPNARWVLLAFVVGCQAIGLLGAFAVPSGDTEWYRTLSKPAFQPPSWLFGPVWTVLYVLMAIAAWRVWRLPSSKRRTIALVLFVVQLLLNGIWTPIFFGAESPTGGLVVLILLAVALGVTVVAFFRNEATAGWLLVPYVGWTSFALALNAAIVSLN